MLLATGRRFFGVIPLHLTYSNSFDHLFIYFAKCYKQTAPFEKSLILVPSFSTEYYLKKKLAGELGIYMGIDFSFLQPGIKQLISLFFPEVQMGSHLDLALNLESTLKEIILSFDSLTVLQQAYYKPLYDYFEGSVDTDPKRITAFGDHLASVFHQYGLHAKSLDQDWELKDVTYWQQALWRQLSKEPSFLTHPKQVLKLDPVPLEAPLNLYLFGFNFVPEVYLQILQKLSPYINMHLFQLSPCRHFWTDIQAPFEKNMLLSKLRKKGAPKLELEDLSSYLSDTNPLLSNLGKLSRKYNQMLEEAQIEESIEHYVIPKAALAIEHYKEYHEGLEHTLSDDQMTLLKSVQMDMLSLRKPQEKHAVEKDCSIQVHQVTTAQREIEVLYDYLSSLFEKEKDLSLQDVMILVPEIEKYIPYIESQFGSSSSPFEYTFHDYPFSIFNSALRGFYHVMELIESRWDKEALYRLFEHPLLQERFQITKDQVEEWKQWIEEVNIQWGLNPQHQKAHLQQEYGKLGDYTNSDAYSWKDFFERILDQLTKTHKENPFERQLNRLGFTDAKSLNTFAELLQGLSQDLEPLESNSEATFEQWSQYLISLIQAYFGKEYEESKEIQALNRRIEEVSRVSVKLKESHYSFETFWYYLKKDLSVFHTEVYSHQLETLSFYSLFSRPFRPAKVICVLGLNDEVFPRNPLDDPLSELKKFTDKSYCPKTIDFDRYQFLELILLTKKTLYLSYLGYSPHTHKPQLSSLFIQELLAYLDRSYKINQQIPSQVIEKVHPHLKFDASYFKSENFQMDGYALAKSYYQTPKEKALSVLTQAFNNPKPLHTSIKQIQKLETLPIQKLNTFVRNPLQFLLNQHYQIYLKEEKWENTDQNYVLSNLQQAILRKKEFLDPQSLLEEKSLPRGLFKEVVEDSIHEQLEQVNFFLNHLGLKKEDICLLELREDIYKVEQIAPSHWLVPCLEIELSVHKKVRLTGTVEMLTEKGLLSISRSSFENMWCQWPTVLIIAQLSNLLNKKFQPNLHFIRSSKSFSFQIDNPEEELRRFVNYYALGQQQFIPFLPNWVPTFLNKDIEEVKNNVKRDLQSDHFNYPYAKALINPDCFPQDKEIQIWQLLAKDLFKETYESMGFFQK